MKFIFNSTEVLAPFEVVNDDDVQVFLCENSDVNTKTSLCVTTERKTKIIPNAQGPDNELVNEDIVNVCESNNCNGVGLDNIDESLLSPNDFQNADVFSIGVDNEDEAIDSWPSTLKKPKGAANVIFKLPSRRRRLQASKRSVRRQRGSSDGTTHDGVVGWVCAPTCCYPSRTADATRLWASRTAAAQKLAGAW
ncbi:hypothetical protein EZV62_007120 [Acer yangbiense]|uniref:Uncharacterized protein n=1 Tax=Acer yangbiense TaxID=1000413 RepID=A0A5C7I9F4_9ROSI|nr:hypothetical protein EZV62_007120 [Acer yangbiense]